jgi:hypothetical protein
MHMASLLALQERSRSKVSVAGKMQAGNGSKKINGLIVQVVRQAVNEVAGDVSAEEREALRTFELSLRRCFLLRRRFRLMLLTTSVPRPELRLP